MKIVLSLLLIILIILSTGFHAYFVWKKKDYRTLFVQIGIVAISILLGIVAINDFSIPSISHLLNTLSPLEK